MASNRYMPYSPSRSAAPHSPHISGIRSSLLAEQEKYLSELLAERQKLGPFMPVLPHCCRLLNQEIMRITSALGNATSLLDQSGLEHGSPLTTGGLFSNGGAAADMNMNGWASPFQSERLGLMQSASARSWLGSQGSFSSLVVKKTMRVDIPVDKFPTFNFVGRLLGPRGNSLKRVEASTDCRVLIRGHGSIKDSTRVKLCGHGTIAAAYFLFTSGIAEGDLIEFVTKSGILSAKKIHTLQQSQDVFSIELDFPVVPIGECNKMEVPSIPATLNGLSVINVKKTTNGDLLVELSSGEDLLNIHPNFDEIHKCAGRGIILTAPAPPGSGFDIYSRFFCPKLGVNEDPVCGSAHCALAPYWSKKLGKQSIIAYMASPRGGRLDLQLQEETQRVRIQGEAVTVMTDFGDELPAGIGEQRF